MVGDGVRMWGGRNVPSQMPVSASRLYAANQANLLALLVADGVVTVDLDDEIIDAATVTHDGKVRFAPAAEALEGGPA
jgi:NAD(P) transhydrogenase subunit alpha